MSTSKSADETSKRAIAKKVIAVKRRYFVPEHGVTVEADDAVEAADKAVKQTKQQEEDVHG